MTKITEIKPIDFGDKAAVKREIEKFAEKYAYAEVEHALEISPSGNMYMLKGIRGNVNSEILGKDILHGSISIHNHFVPKGNNMGDSFSKQDLSFAAEYKLGTQYLVSGERRNAFEYTKKFTREKIEEAYNKAKNILLLSASLDETIIFSEQQQIIEILASMLKGFEFYDKF